MSRLYRRDVIIAILLSIILAMLMKDFWIAPTMPLFFLFIVLWLEELEEWFIYSNKRRRKNNERNGKQ